MFSQVRHISTIEKNLLSSNISSRCPHNMVNFGLLAAETDPAVWAPQLIMAALRSRCGHYIFALWFLSSYLRTNFNGFRVFEALFQQLSRLGSVTARQSSSGRQPNFAALNRGRHLYSAGQPSRWALAHISSLVLFMVALWNRSGDYIFALWFHLLSIYLSINQSIFFSSPNLSRRRLDVCHSSTHGLALVRI